MEKTIVLILIGKRVESAVQVQGILTEMGCIIKTRLGIHESKPDECANTGLVILELTGTQEEKDELAAKLKKVPEVTVNLVEMKL